MGTDRLRGTANQLGAIREARSCRSALISRVGYSSLVRQSSQEDVSEAFGIAHAIEASDFDQFASEEGLQAFVAVKVGRRIVTFDRCPRSVKSPLQNLPVERVEFVSKRSEQSPYLHGQQLRFDFFSLRVAQHDDSFATRPAT